MAPAAAIAYRTAGRLACRALLLACLAIGTARADDLPVVSAIEAACLSKFAPFVDWPGPRHAAPTPPTLCILGDDRIGATIPADQAAVRQVAPDEQVSGCQILFIGAIDTAAARAALARTGTAPTLTVTTQAAPEGKGIINFVIVDDRVRFEIDDAEAARHGLRISSNLLSLAVAVKLRNEAKVPR